MSTAVGTGRSGPSTQSSSMARKMVFDGVVVRKPASFSWYYKQHLPDEDDGENYAEKEEDSEEVRVKSEPDEMVLQGHNSSKRAMPRPRPYPDTVSCSILKQVCGSERHVHKTIGSFPFPITNPCPILSFFNLEYTNWGFLCRHHKTLVRPRDLCRHIHGHEVHRPKGKVFSKAAQNKFLNHILSSYAIDNKDMEFPLPVLPTESLPGLEPFLAIPCPIPGCSTWRNSKSLKSMSGHLNRKHGGEEVSQKYKSAQLESRYILKPFYHSISQSDPKSLTTVVFHKDYMPSRSQNQ